ncbi:uncharacterized membrane protein HdeD (DUF308 family) [Tepidamorphus gemmatus]|uniref:Uncharacterized membrane protein HdeD (DUF308 family) n=1 Tax=Tepidamorphus gemmatus TaxID=747076 RepID=A0A4R3MHR1_9HYPH|nr:HdeD family acid-resistance protein [Tepidamorphus gemmatus]TCT11957.1 uncharacterized membrane protein HdeD (DUF308 family) [Tepidamorphus gemmatus]
MQSSNAALPSAAEMTERAREAIRENRTLFMIEGVVLVVLGLFAVLWPQIATLTTAVFVGWLFIIGGIVRLVSTVRHRQAPGFWWSVLTGVLAILVGLVLAADPFAGALSLTMVLIAMFVIEGIFQIIAGLEFRKAAASSWVWIIISGVIDLALAVLLLAGWPGTAVWAVGLLVGINLLFAGLALFMTAMAAKDLPA